MRFEEASGRCVEGLCYQSVVYQTTGQKYIRRHVITIKDKKICINQSPITQKQICKNGNETPPILV